MKKSSRIGPRSDNVGYDDLLQAPFTYDYEGRALFDEPSGRHIKGDGPLYRCYEALDGWFFMGMHNPDALAHHVLESIEGLEGISGITPEALEAFLMKTFKTRGILCDMGYSSADIDQMITDRVVSESWGTQYLPD